MSRPTLHAAALLLALASTCTPSALQVQARLANSVGLAGNRMLPVMIDTYRADGLRVIEQARADGLPREEAERRLAAHVAAWRPVWGDCEERTGQCVNGAWPALRATHNAWSEALEAQIGTTTRPPQPLDLPAVMEHAQRMHSAFCALRGAVPLPARNSIPQIPGAECPAQGTAR